MTGQKRRLLLGAAILTMSVVASPIAANAQGADADQQISVAIQAQRLSDALRQLAGATGLQLVYDTRITDGKTSPGVSGTMSSRSALAQLLTGSGLNFQFSGDRTVIITAGTAAGGDGVRAVGVVSVEGVGGAMPFGEMVSPVNGTNGSRDVEATEGTGSYTTGAVSIVSKTPQSIKDTPQTVSVITSQRIADQNLVSIKSILDTMPGITSTPGTSGEEFEVYSRGFRVTTYSYDGGAPVSYNNNARPMLNIAEYDSVQLARGATGLFGGYGAPGGMINLVRKKPLDHEQFQFEQDIGSWENFRSMADYTGPLTKDRSLRGRVVASHQSRNYFYNIADSEKTGVYGILEYDLTPKTLVTVGASGNWERGTLNYTGLPRYSDGSPIDWPISTCLCVPGAGEDAKKLNAFATISHQISSDWSMKLNALYDYQNIDTKVIYVTATSIKPGATTGTGSVGGQYSTNPARQVAIDYSISGRTHLLGREITLAAGASYQHTNRDGGYTSFYSTKSIPDIFKWDSATYVIQYPTKKDYLAEYVRDQQFGVYGNLKVEVVKGLYASVGMRYSTSLTSSIFRYDYTPIPQINKDLKDHSYSRPNIGINFNVTKNLTLYGSHQNIYYPQIFARELLDGVIPDPITGSNTEGGIKWESSDKKLNASLAAFKIIQNNILGSDYSGATPKVSPMLYDTRSKGIEFEVNGEVLPGWQVSANYAYNDNSFTQSSFYSKTITETPATSYTPRHLGKLWTTYRGVAGGPLAGVILGGGATIQSKSFKAAQFCSFGSGGFVCTPYDFTTKGYATFALKGGYQLTRNIEISVNLNNLTNYKTYLASSQQQAGAYNYYIEPRSFMATVRFKW